MTTTTEGKGPGYALMWGAIAVLFIGGPTLAAWWGYVPWWSALAVDIVIAAAFAWLMVTAVWAR